MNILPCPFCHRTGEDSYLQALGLYPWDGFPFEDTAYRRVYTHQPCYFCNGKKRISLSLWWERCRPTWTYIAFYQYLFSDLEYNWRFYREDETLKESLINWRDAIRSNLTRIQCRFKGHPHNHTRSYIGNPYDGLCEEVWYCNNCGEESGA